MKIIDPHLHLFNLEQGDYHWLKAENTPFWSDKEVINKSYSEQNIQLNTPLELCGFIHIEAGFDNKKPWRELAWLESYCHLPFHSISSIDLFLDSNNFSKQLSTLLAYKSFVGVRHILDDQALTILTNKQCQKNIQQLNIRHLIFEVQMPLSDNNAVEHLCKLISSCPNITFIINHAGTPPYHMQTVAWHHWQSNLTKLAFYTNIALKCSGWEMIERGFDQVWLSTVLKICLSIFGDSRIMLASNFPLCLFTHSYQAYWGNIKKCLTSITTNDSKELINKVCYLNAKHWYQL